MIKSRSFNLWIFVLSIGFIACDAHETSKEYGYSFKSLRTIDFNIGFNTWTVSVENYDLTEQLSFADLRTNKKIILCPLSGDKNKMTIIPIDSIVNLGAQIAAYEIINRDTLLLFEEYGNRIYHLDFQGSLKRVFDLNEALNKSTKYDLYYSRMGFGYNNGSSDLLFHNSFTTYNDTSGNNYRNNRERLIDMQRIHPYFFKINALFSDSLEYEFGLDNFYARFTNSNDLFFESPHYLANDTVIYAFSNYSDTIYEVNGKDLKLKKLHQIKSDFTEIGYRPAKLEDWKLDTNLPNELGRTKGFIQQIEIDDHKDLVYVLVLHELLEASSDARRIKSWSILIYDLSFKKLGEVKMDEMKYGSFIISTKEGLLISNAPSKQYDKDFYEKTTFELFEVVKN